MSEPLNDYAERRRLLARDIARQRGELTQAYLRLEKPIHYAEHGLTAFGFLRKNPWIFAAVPAAINIFSTVLRIFRKPKSLPPAHVRASSPPARPRARGVIGFATILVQQGMRLYQLYRRVRPYLS